VVERGAQVADTDDLQPGTRVYGTWGHRSEAVIDATTAGQRVLSPQADPVLGIYSHIGPIALNGVLDTAVRLGETVAVFGLGVVGQLVAQLLRCAGARVIGVDSIAQRRRMAVGLGLDVALDPSEPVAERVREITGGRGADVCVEASGSTRALHEATRACAYAGRVVALGFYQGEAAGLFLAEEFHHNRISLVCSQIGGVAVELQHRWDRLRLVHTFMDLAARGDVRCTPLITHRVPAHDAPRMYELLDSRPHEVLQAVLDFGDSNS
jgi:threonine dehydrogenase-like Zn-dependent dehydrogenase